MSLTLPDSGAPVGQDGRRHAPSADRNADAILAVLAREAPPRGQMLELASGTGQHAARFAAALPGLQWQPTDVDAANLASIAAWAAFARTTNLRPPRVLDATLPGWADACGGQDVILLVNLLHLIPAQAVETLLAEAARALAPTGVLLIYGPFLRQGQTISDGDAAFHASLQAQDPRIGYKDADWVTAGLVRARLAVMPEAMPANNLMLIARRR
jgi:SAM-dependent methyltransferase